jgi:acetolactate synthase-1/2/3 large subunit
LATIKHKALPIKIFILDNDGYHSIRQSQMNHFPKNVAGTGSEDGLGFPDFTKVATAFELNSTKVESIEDLKKMIVSDVFLNQEPHIFLLKLDKSQNFEPKLQSRRLSDGSLSSPELHDMAPFLSRNELRKNILKD